MMLRYANDVIKAVQAFLTGSPALDHCSFLQDTLFWISHLVSVDQEAYNGIKLGEQDK